MSGKRQRGIAIKPEGLALIEKKMAENGYNRAKLVEKANLCIDTVNRVRRDKVDRKTIEAIAQALNLEPTDIVDATEWYRESPTVAQEHCNIDWRIVCDIMLEKQQETQRLRRKATEMGFEINVHVPLGLVEREQQQRRGNNQYRHNVYDLEKEVITKTYEHDEFLKQAIGQSLARKNKHIAIVGEPGAGKTTLLSAIANFIQSQTEDLPICITLASLQGRTLQEHLLKIWLPEAMGLVDPEIVITPEIENQLITRFRKGGVWLLLDGVDEMGADSPVQALTTIQAQLTNWLTKARVVLTCRLNVWDACVNNTLTGFDTYKTQEFKPEQVDQFIQEWFTHAGKSQLGEELQVKLKETRRERIRELVINPLRLALLCQTFYLDKQGDLPETKAAFYQRFISYFYEWKPEFVSIDLIKSVELKNELHQALGKLALAGINSAARFRLRQSLASREMGERLFKLVCELGWLNLVDRDAQTDEPVYAFFHPNFQEYFAALTVDDWHYFLNHNNDNPNPFVKYNNKDCVYRVFEPQWKEVILLWLGREDVAKQQKEEFINVLVKFEDGCKNYYHYRAYFFAAAGISEFKDSSHSNEIVAQIVELSFGTFNEKKQERETFLAPIEQEARAALLETDSTRAIHALIDLNSTNLDSSIHWEVSDILEKISPQSLQSIEKVDINLKDLLHSCQNQYIRLEAAKILGKFDPNNWNVTQTPLDILINTSTESLAFARDEWDMWQLHNAAEKSLTEISIGKSEAIVAIINMLPSGQSWCWRIPRILEKIALDNKQAITALNKLLQPNRDDKTRLLAAKSLLLINSGNPDAIKALTNIVDTTQNLYTRGESAEELWQIGQGNSNALNALIDKVCNSNLDWGCRNYTWNILCQSHVGNPDVIIPMINLLLDIKQDRGVRCLAIWKLEEIAADNPRVRAALTQLLDTETNETILRLAASIWVKINPGNQNAIDKAVNVLTNLLSTPFQDEYCRLNTSESLYKIAPGNLKAVNTIINLLLSSEDWEDGVSEDDYFPSVVYTAANNLKKISESKGLALIVTRLKNWLADPLSENEAPRRSLCSEVILYCAQKMSYPTFYQAWHSLLSSIHPEAPDCIAVSDTPTVQALENQFLDTTIQIQSTIKTHGIVINTSALEGETDTSAIAQEICNQIYLTAFPNHPEIPEVNNAPQLKRILPQIKKQLQKPNLALIINNCEPNQELIAFYRKITDVLHIAWITDEALESPLRGFPPEQPNLISAIQAWIDEIG